MKSMKRLRTATLRLSMCCLMMLLGTSLGCRTVRVIPADKAVIRVKAGKSFTPAINGWFVPDARLLQILERGLIDANDLPH